MSGLRPCHHCGNDRVTFYARPTRRSKNKPGRIFLCRSCGWEAVFDTPERDSDANETRLARDASGIAQWNKASVANMRPLMR